MDLSLTLSSGKTRSLGAASCCKIAISNNVGGVKRFLSTLQHALEKERDFVLVGSSRFPTWARF